MQNHRCLRDQDMEKDGGDIYEMKSEPTHCVVMCSVYCVVHSTQYKLDLELQDTSRQMWTLDFDIELWQRELSAQ